MTAQYMAINMLVREATLMEINRRNEAWTIVISSTSTISERELYAVVLIMDMIYPSIFKPYRITCPYLSFFCQQTLDWMTELTFVNVITILANAVVGGPVHFYKSCRYEWPF